MANYGGLSPKRYLSGAPYTGAVRQYSVAAGNGVAIFPGDLVKLAGTAQTVNDTVMQDVVQAATGDVFMGVCVGVLPDTRDSLLYRAASTLRVLLVADDPNLEFEIPEIDTGTALTLNDIGLNANISVGTGSTTLGLSAMQLDNGTEQTTNTLDLKITGFVNSPGNAVGSTARWLVRINRHRYVDQLAGV